MSDDKNKRGKPDSYLISFKQKYEVDYALKQLQEQFPNKTKAQVEAALFNAASKIDPSEGRKKIMEQASKILKN